MTEKLKKLIELLISKTVAKKAIWNKASGEKQFKLSIQDGSAITVSEFTGQYNNTFWGITIFNNNGDAIERIDTEDFVYSQEELDLIKTFHKVAHDSYYKVEETIDALFDSINNQDTVGVKVEEQLSKFETMSDEELPF